MSKQTQRRRAFIAELRASLKKDKRTVAEWKKKFASDNYYALEWSSGLFSCVARMRVTDRALRALTTKREDGSVATIGELHAGFSRVALQRARSIANTSTSGPSNMLDRCHLEAVADLAKELSYRVEATAEVTT